MGSFRKRVKTPKPCRRKTLSARAAILAPFMIAFAPKCPLCLLPLCAAVGVSLPTGPLLTGAVALIAIGWVAFLPRGGRVALALAAGALVVGGRLVGVAALGWTGVALMFALSISEVRVGLCHSTRAARGL